MQVYQLTSGAPVPYLEAWQWQRELVGQRQRGEIDDTLLLLTHPPVISYGKRADPAHLLLSREEYARRGIELVETDRGGDVTYHGPGQLVAYPILHLGEGSRDLHRYVRFLETVVLAACVRMGVPDAARAPWHAGIWVGEGYLAALGVRVSRWVTCHGFALNVTEETRGGLATIIPCGVPGKSVVTLESLTGSKIPVSEAAATVSGVFLEEYRREYGKTAR